MSARGHTENGDPVDAAESRISAAKARSILDASHEAFVAMDAGGFITDWNREAERSFGWLRDEALGQVLADLIVPERYRAAHWEGLQRYLETGEGPVLGARLELSALHRDGHEFPVEMTLSAAQPDGAVAFYALLRDISARKVSERLLVAQAAVTRALAGAASGQAALEAMLGALAESMEWEAGSYWAVDVNQAVLKRVASWHAPSLVAREFERLSADTRLPEGVGLPGLSWQRREPVSVEDFAAETTFSRARAAASAGLHAAICVPVQRRGEVVGVLEFLRSEVRAPDPSITRVLGPVGLQIGEVLAVIEERERRIETLESLALTDELTGLANRRAWDDGLRRELARADREGHSVCIALLDLDHFKRFNDTNGHQAGDALLAEAAAVWSSTLRAGDFLARYGGEEFAALFPTHPIDAAVAVVKRLCSATPAGQTTSAGVALWNGRESAPELVARADTALYAAKNAGRNKTLPAP